MITLHDVKYCAEECERQQSGEMSVFGMVNALDCLRDRLETIGSHKLVINYPTIMLLGTLIEPNKNKNHLRQVPVSFANGNTAIKWDVIPRALTNFVEGFWDLNALQVYKEFELIHPFIDGNGRVGSLLYNFRNYTIDKPVTPPKIF